MSGRHPPFYNTNSHFYPENKSRSFRQPSSSQLSPQKVSPYNPKSNNCGVFRQTMNMKRYKYQKIAFQSKPISVSNYEENLFAMESKKSECFEDHYQSANSSSRMMPSSSSVWVTNTKRMQKKWAMNKKRDNIEELVQGKQAKSNFYSNDYTIHDLSNYFQSVKNYFACHKKKVDRERRMKMDLMNQIRCNLEQEGNLNIVRLKPSTHQHRRISRKQTMSHEDQQKSRSPELVEYSSVNHLNNVMPYPTKFYSTSKERTISESTEIKRMFQKKITKREDVHYIFGEFKAHQHEEELQKLRILYYRDFLWKISFNRGVMFQSTHEVHRFYIGKGNNSRLIRKIMAKRPWWTQSPQQENANFIWTQLKIYDVYKGQRCLKQPLDDQNLFLSNLEEVNGAKQFESTKTAESGCGLRVQNKQDKNAYILNESKYKLWREYIKKKGGSEKRGYEDMRQRSNVNMQKIKITHKITNHLQFSRVIGNKKALYRTMQAYFNVNNISNWTIPLTFHITGGLQNEEYLSFLRDYYKKSKQGFNCWIVKPGELSNRGRDIKFCANLQEIKDQIKQKKTNSNGSARTYIVQLYLDKPFLYQGRKFDLRHYLMITSTHGKIRGYFYQEGYVRTTSYPYSLESNSPGVHLTNDAIQKYLPNYSKYEKANKLSYEQLNEYMLKLNPEKGFFNTIFPQIKAISKDIIFAAFPLIDPQRRQNNFQIFGIDIMIDENYKCWLIEVNTNPCIEVNCPVLSAVIPPMLENAFTIGLDSLVSPPLGKVKITQNNYLLENKFELVFDEQIQGRQILLKYREENIQVGNYGDDDDNYQSCDQEQCET